MIEIAGNLETQRRITSSLWKIVEPNYLENNLFLCIRQVWIGFQFVLCHFASCIQMCFFWPDCFGGQHKTRDTKACSNFMGRQCAPTAIMENDTYSNDGRIIETWIKSGKKLLHHP